MREGRERKKKGEWMGKERKGKGRKQKEEERRREEGRGVKEEKRRGEQRQDRTRHTFPDSMAGASGCPYPAELSIGTAVLVTTVQHPSSSMLSRGTCQGLLKLSLTSELSCCTS